MLILFVSSNQMQMIFCLLKERISTFWTYFDVLISMDLIETSFCLQKAL